MINPTGMVNTDLLIGYCSNSQNSKSNFKDWINILSKHGVPLQFQIIKKFLKPDFGSNPPLMSMEVTQKHLDAIEYLL